MIGKRIAAATAMMAGAVRNQRVHLLAYAAIRGMPLRRRAQLDEMHGLAGVHLHVEPDAICHRDGIGRQLRRGPLRTIASCNSADASITCVPVVSARRLRDRIRFDVPVTW